MLSDTIGFFSMTRQTLLNEESSRRLAMGIAFGMVIGLLPKDSLLVWITGVVLMVSTANLLSALVSGFAFSWVGFLIDPFTHKLGAMVLTANGLESTWTWLYEVPLMPWTRFNNTVVMGSWLVAMVMFIPVYLAGYRFLRTWGFAIHIRLRKTWLYRWLVAPPGPSVEEA